MTEPVLRSLRGIAPAEGKLGVLLPGLGAVATTFLAGVESVRRGWSEPVGSLTQLASLRVGGPETGRNVRIREFLPLAQLDDMVFGAWDPLHDDALQAARNAAVLDERDLARTAAFLASIKPMPAVFQPEAVPRIRGANVKRGRTARDLAEQLRQDIRDFRASQGLARVVMIWCGSTERYMRSDATHQTLAAFERAMFCGEGNVSPSMLYAWAALREGVSFSNCAPNPAVDLPCMLELARDMEVPVSGKDLKTGQTWLKTVIAPGIRARMLGLSGWYSTNIIGNRDGQVLSDPDSFRTKEESKLHSLGAILPPEEQPELYGEYSHTVRIDYYPPRGDNKESWDNIDIFGWMGYPMQIKVNFLCRDSILAAPMVLDLALFSDLAHRAGRAGVQEWLGFYFKSPMYREGMVPEHDLFAQQTLLRNALREMMGEEQVTQPEIEYFQC